MSSPETQSRALGEPFIARGIVGSKRWQNLLVPLPGDPGVWYIKSHELIMTDKESFDGSMLGLVVRKVDHFAKVTVAKAVETLSLKALPRN